MVETIDVVPVDTVKLDIDVAPTSGDALNDGEMALYSEPCEKSHKS